MRILEVLSLMWAWTELQTDQTRGQIFSPWLGVYSWQWHRFVDYIPLQGLRILPLDYFTAAYAVGVYVQLVNYIQKNSQT